MFFLISIWQNKISKNGWCQRYPVLCEEFENEKKRGQKGAIHKSKGTIHKSNHSGIKVKTF